MNGRNNRQTTNGRRLRLASLAPVLFATATVSVMLLSSASATVTNGFSYTPPYKTLGASIQVSSSVAGCGKYTVQKTPKWSPSLGILSVSASSKASGCQSPGVGTDAQWYSYLDLDVPTFKASSNSSVTLNETWAISLAGAWSLTPYTSCKLNYKVALSECLATASVQLYTYTILEDESNFSAGFDEAFNFVLDNYSTVENYSQYYNCNPTCTHSFGNFTFGGPSSGSFVFSQNVYNNFTAPFSLVKGDTYGVYVVFLVEAYAQAEAVHAKTTGSASAMAAFNMATLGNGAKLSLLTIT